jgi:hypothetical protein
MLGPLKLWIGPGGAAAAALVIIDDAVWQQRAGAPWLGGRKPRPAMHDQDRRARALLEVIKFYAGRYEPLPSGGRRRRQRLGQVLARAHIAGLVQRPGHLVPHPEGRHAND